MVPAKVPNRWPNYAEVLYPGKASLVDKRDGVLTTFIYTTAIFSLIRPSGFDLLLS